MAEFNFTELITQNEFICEVLNHVSDAIYFCDNEERFFFINKAAENLDGYTNEELYGRSVYEAYNLNDTPLLRALRMEKPIKNITFRYNVNGLEVFQVCNARPLFVNGKKIGACTIQRDVTKLKEIIENNIRLQQRSFPALKDTDKLNSAFDLSGFDRLIGQHPSFIKCLSMAATVAQTDSPVLLTGATGCGKELFARCIHDVSNRRGKPFLAINCAAIPESLLESILFGTAKGAYTGAVERIGLFEQAEGGTLFLDEINSMPLFSQSKLLRVLEEKEVQHLGGHKPIKVDIRIISSSNVLPREAISNHQIRQDLFYRLSVVNIIIPPLSSRKSDIMLLTKYFIAQYNKLFQKNVKRLDSDVEQFFIEYKWPGNVRQLRNCLESAMNFVEDQDTLIKKKHLPQYLFGDEFIGFTNYDQEHPIDEKKQSTFVSQTFQDNSDVFSVIRNREKQEIINALLEHRGNVTRTAKALNMHRQSLVYRMKKYGIK